ncbi:MAG: aminotransferase class V-fold PLP-dependent enzyme [Thermomicrobiales bacterium]|nr:aminotransferase class V-fold PLP-dependent enzyme [Thermomicrobiales bacterium]
MVDTTRTPAQRIPILERIGVRQVINAGGTITLAGGSNMAPETTAAMAEVANAFVFIEELNAAVGKKIAEATGAEAGYVTSCSAAAMTIAAAACITGTDQVKISKLPDTTGMKNEFLIHRSHRIGYDQAYRVAGGKLIEFGLPYKTAAWEMEAAVTENTIGAIYHDTPNVGPGALPFPEFVAIAHKHKLPVIVDSASMLPPVDHLRRWIRQGADLVIYSGGKGIRGPQDTGLLAGRTDLIAAARLNGPPHASVGRGMKTSKEAMVGLWVALDTFLSRDHDIDYAAHLAQARALADFFETCADTRVVINDNREEWPAPILRIFPISGSWDPATVDAALMSGNPAIKIVAEWGGLLIHTHGLYPGQEQIIIDRLSELLPPK